VAEATEEKLVGPEVSGELSADKTERHEYLRIRSLTVTAL
jgi:hypothetical protein